MNAPIRQILHKPNLAICMVAEAVELLELRIIYKQRKAIKAQVLTDFVVKMTKTEVKQLAQCE